MSEFAKGVLDLFEQLLNIGAEHTEVLIAAMVMAFIVIMTVILSVIVLVISIPIMLVRGLFTFCKWLYCKKRGISYSDDYYEEDECEAAPAKRKHRGKVQQYQEDKQEELPPVLPHWMNQKGGRLL